MMNFNRFALSCFVLLLFSAELFSQDLMDYSHSLKYAEYLFQNKQYSFSATEFERITFLEPADTVAKLKVVQSYRLMNNLTDANSRIEKYFPGNYPDYPEKFADEKFKLLFLEQQYPNAWLFLQENKTIDSLKIIEYKLGTLLMQHKWAEAKTFTDDFLFLNQKNPVIDNLYKISLQGTNINYKSPVCAALLSAIIPGSGKVYTHQWKDGIYAFVVISAFSWLTYNSINHNGFNAGSIIYGSIALSFYTANIYGSIKSAIRYNQKKNRFLTNEVEKIIIEQ